MRTYMNIFDVDTLVDLGGRIALLFCLTTVGRNVLLLHVDEFAL